MRKFGVMAMFVGVVGLGACSGGSSEPDASTVTPDAPEVPAQCNPLENSGCAAGEKCTYNILATDPFTGAPDGRTKCMPAGDVAEGDSCMFGRDGPDTGVDNCQGGLFCVHGRCAKICSVFPDNCAEGVSVCTLYNGFWTDFDVAQVGFCDRLCDVFDVGSCASGEGCFLNTGRGHATCSTVIAAGQQGDMCVSIDGCAPGLGCILTAPETSGYQCSNYCRVSNGNTPDGQSCQAKLGGTAITPACVRVNLFYAGEAPDVDDEIGMCVDCGHPAYEKLTACIEATGMKP